MTREEILAGESRDVEFKVQRPAKSIVYMKSVVAFANGKGGRIVFGIDDDTRKIVGIPEESIFREMDAITNAISDSCEPVIVPDIYPQTIDEKTIIIVEISAGKQSHTTLSRTVSPTAFICVCPEHPGKLTAL